jgi:hypothetical protein
MCLKNWERAGTYEYAVKSLWVVSGSEGAGILHMRPQIPELLQANTRNVHNVIALRNWRLRVVSILESRAQWHDEADQIFVQRKQAEQLRWSLSVRLRLGFGFLRRLLICSHRFRIQVLHLEYVHWDAAAIPSTCPLGVLGFVRNCADMEGPGLESFCLRVSESLRNGLNLSSRTAGPIALPCANSLCCGTGSKLLQQRSGELEGIA